MNRSKDRFEGVRYLLNRSKHRFGGVRDLLSRLRRAVDAGVPLITDIKLASAVIEALRAHRDGADTLPTLAWDDYLARKALKLG